MQTLQGAPFDVFLSADADHPKLLVDKGFAVPGTQFVYALGRLVLWSPDPAGVKSDGAETLREKKFNHLAIANPKIAPYGKATLQALQALGLWEGFVPLLVQGEDIGQAFQFAASQNAELGFVALSQILASGNGKKGSWWEVPDKLYEPIDQEAVLLKHGQNNPAARALLDYLRGAKSAEFIKQAGYGLK
jgi:molybdate transport system substrate-binding protein